MDLFCFACLFWAIWWAICHLQTKLHGANRNSLIKNASKSSVPIVSMWKWMQCPSVFATRLWPLIYMLFSNITACCGETRSHVSRIYFVFDLVRVNMFQWSMCADYTNGRWISVAVLFGFVRKGRVFFFSLLLVGSLHLLSSSGDVFSV